MLREPRVVFLDTETTGFGPEAEIVDVGIVDASGRTLFESLVRPQQPIPPDAYAVHGISDAMVVTAPEWPDVGPLVSRILLESAVVVYNAAFDLQMVNQMNARYGAPPLPASWHCAMLQYAAFAGIWNERYGNFRWHKLDAALAAFGLSPATHRATSDAEACRVVVRGMAGLLHS
jgi:DNA polymerase III subunit epsilon